MIPLRDNVPASRFPAVTVGLIIANTLIFFYELSLGPQLQEFIVRHGFVPVRFMLLQRQNPFDLSRFGPVFSSMFLHGGFLHLIGNMWMLWIFGDNVEDRLGRGRYLFFYFLCGLASVLAQTWASPLSRSPLIGASGAISGVIGAYALLYPRARVLTLIPLFFFFYLLEIPAFFFIGFWFVVQFLQGAAQQASRGAETGGIAWWAHVGGFLTGMLLLRLFLGRPKRRRPG